MTLANLGPKTILLLGRPNSGKTAIFNQLCNQSQKVANYSGITVDVAVGKLAHVSPSIDYTIVDLPGVYSLFPISKDEAITVGTILGANPVFPQIHGVVAILDWQNIIGGLALLLSLKEIMPKEYLKVIINKCDIACQKEAVLDGNFANFLNIEVLPYSSLKDNPKLVAQFVGGSFPDLPALAPPGLALNAEAKELFPGNFTMPNWQMLEKHEVAQKLEPTIRTARALSQGLKVPTPLSQGAPTAKLDEFLLNPFFGSVIFVAIFYALFHALYVGAAPLMDFIEQGFNLLVEWMRASFPSNIFTSFLVDGLIGGVAGVLVFLPQVMILFFLLSLLEQSGYIARASVFTDKVMSYFGLNGKAFLPFLSGFACSVPAIMSTRTIKDTKERITTLMVLPFITCSARLPVYILLVGTFVPNGKVWGWLDQQALAFFFLYFFGSLVALLVAKIFRLTIFKGKSTSFIIDLPFYQRPSLRAAWKNSYRHGKGFLKKVGTIILAASALLWVLSSFPRIPDEQLANEQSQLEYSIIGRLGKGLEPIIAPLGLDWKMGVGILVSFGARELFVSTLGTLYSLSDVDEESQSLRQRLSDAVNPATGKKVFNLAVAWSLLIFFALACQCMSTLVIVREETGSSLLAVLMFVYMGIFAYLGAWATYQLLSNIL